MKIVTDTATVEDANTFGELLRDYCFVPDKYGNSLGCYSTFDLRSSFLAVPLPPDVERFLLGEPDPEWSNREEGLKSVSCYSDGNILVAWFWDGDGTLYFREGNRAVINDDCKKDYVWKWVPQ